MNTGASALPITGDRPILISWTGVARMHGTRITRIKTDLRRYR